MAGDLHQVPVQFAFVPNSIDILQFVIRQSETALHQIVGLRNELHDRVLDAVVNHLYKVPGRSRTEPGHARFPVDFRRGCLQDGTNPLVGLVRSAGHDARSMTCAFFATRDTHAEELDAFRRQVAGAHIGVFEVGVAGVDDEIALVQVRQQILDDRIHRSAGRHK